LNGLQASPSLGVKNKAYSLTALDRTTQCSVGWDVVWERTDAVRQAYFYFSDQVATYTTLVYYPALHRALPDKSQPYSVAADHAELRHYLARLGRNSRCGSRCLHAL